MEILDYVVSRFNFWIYITLMMIGLYAMIAKRNYIKKLIGMSIFQTAIILFYVSAGVKEGSTIPIIEHHAPTHEVAASGHRTQDDHGIDPDHYANPLPHVLMLTAIVVGVATLGVGLAVVQKVYDQFGTIEEPEILERLQNE